MTLRSSPSSRHKASLHFSPFFLLPPAKAVSLPASWMGNGANPEGILQQSPGLRGTSYPGSIASGRANPNGVASVGGERGHNPVGVETWFARIPRVALPLLLGRGIKTAVVHCKHLGCFNGGGLSERAGSQPWAGGRNPLGIGRPRRHSGIVGNDK